MIYVTEDQKNIYTTNVSSGTVSILTESLMQPGGAPPPPGAQPGGQPGPPPGAQPHATWTQTLVSVSRGSEGFDVSPDGKQLWTVSADDGSIAVIDIASRKVISKIDAKALGANRLQFTPDGKMVLISSLRIGNLFVYDAKSQKELKQIAIGHGAAGILVDTDGSRAFLGCTGDNYLAIVDLKTLEVSGHVDVGKGPDGLAWAIRP